MKSYLCVKGFWHTKKGAPIKSLLLTLGANEGHISHICRYLISIRSESGDRAKPVTAQITPIFSRNDSYIKAF
jgi:hypothetical protein